MPTTYDGVPSNVAFSGVLAIASSTDTNPIEITVSGSLPADFFTGCWVDVTEHGPVNWHANGQWQATVTGANKFTIPAVGNGSGPGGANGFVQALNATPSFVYPADGDAGNSASISQWAQSQADRLQYLAKSTGVAKLAGRRILTYGSTTSWAESTSSVAPTTWVPLTGSPQAWTPMAGVDEDGPLTVDSLSVPLAFGGIWTPGDLLRIRWKTVGAGPAGSYGGSKFGMWYAISPAAIGPPSILSAFTLLAGSTVDAPAPASGTLAVPWSAEVWVPSITFAGTLFLVPAFFTGTLAGGPFTFAVGDADDLLVVEAWRQTGVPQ